MKLLAAITAVLMMLTAPQAVRAADPEVPTLTSPADGVTVDQPLFTWTRVADIAGYEVEVALDDQFVTLSDRAFVLGTAYVPSRTYQAKTHHWRVRVVYVDGARDEWSESNSFTRRWTSGDAPTGTEIVSQPPARVEHLRIIDGVGDVLTTSTIGFRWDAVAGAAYYEVHLSNDPSFPKPARTECLTPHTTLTPYVPVLASWPYLGYIRRPPLSDCLASAVGGAGQTATWQRSGDLLTVQASGVNAGQELLVTYPPSAMVQRVTVVAVSDDQSSFTIADTGAPSDPSGDLQWQPAPSIDTDEDLYVRVRAVDHAIEPDYPYPPIPKDKMIFGPWSDQREAQDTSPPEWLRVNITATSTGGGNMMMPATPQGLQYSGTDVPVLRWDRVQDAPLYKVVIALDQDFTDQVSEYYTPSEVFIPMETFDDVAPNQRYYWYALPCVEMYYCAPDREAILDSKYVGTFAKRSEPVQNLVAQPRTEDGETTALLRWGDALTAAQTQDAAGTSGGATSYDVEITKSTWAKATSYQTDNLAVSTGQLPNPLGPGEYKWRVRPRDGQDIPLAWAEAPAKFTLKGLSTTPNPTPTPTPTATSTAPPNPNPSSSYDQEGSGETSTKAAPPTKPGKPDVSKVTKRKVLVRWRRSSERGSAITGYLVYRSTDGKRFKKVARTTARKTRLSVKRNRTYWFRVVAVSAAGASSPSKKTRIRVR